MLTLNTVTILGAVGEIEITKTKANKPMVRATITTKREWSREGEDNFDIHPIVCWGKAADKFEVGDVTDGDVVLAHGKLAWRSWETSAGKTLRNVEVVVFGLSVDLEARGSEPEVPVGSPVPFDRVVQEDDIPF